MVARPTKNVAALAPDLRRFGNDLLKPAIQEAPEIEAVLAALAPTALFAGMSGSGATCFGLYPTRAAARDAARKLAADRRDWRVWATVLNP